LHVPPRLVSCNNTLKNSVSQGEKEFCSACASREHRMTVRVRLLRPSFLFTAKTKSSKAVSGSNSGDIHDKYVKGKIWISLPRGSSIPAVQQIAEIRTSDLFKLCRCAADQIATRHPFAVLGLNALTEVLVGVNLPTSKHFKRSP